jgi:curved DNA-binding protein CbpA
MAAPLDTGNLKGVLREIFSKIANGERVRHNFKQLYLKYHPDKHPDDRDKAAIFYNSIRNTISNSIGTQNNMKNFSNSQQSSFIETINNPATREALINKIVVVIEKAVAAADPGAAERRRAAEEAEAERRRAAEAAEAAAAEEADAEAAEEADAAAAEEADAAAAEEADAEAAEEADAAAAEEADAAAAEEADAARKRAADAAAAREAAAKANARQSNQGWTIWKDYWDSILNKAFKSREKSWWTQGNPGPTKAQVVALAEKTLKDLKVIPPYDIRRATALKDWSKTVYGLIPDESGYLKTLNARGRKLDEKFDAILTAFEELAERFVRQVREEESRKEEARRANEEAEARAREEARRANEEAEARAREEEARRATKLAEAKAAAELPVRQIKEKLERLNHEYRKAHNRSSARWMPDNTNQGILEEYLDTEADLAEAIARTPLEVRTWSGLPDFKNMITLKDQLNYIKNQIERLGVDVRFNEFDTISNLDDIKYKIADVISNEYSIRTYDSIIPARSNPNYIVLNTSRAYLNEQVKRLEAAREARAKANGMRPGMFSKLGRFAGLFGGRKSRKARKTRKARKSKRYSRRR